MRHGRATFLLLLSLGLTTAAQDTTQLTPVPPKPTCTPILPNGACANLWRNYNQAFAQRQQEELQLYVNRQKELASSAATAPLQQQIADLNKLVADQQAQIKKLQDQIQADAATALQEKSVARQEGFWKGLAIGAGAMLFLFVVILIIRRVARSFTITKKSHLTST
jgi:galactokinase/mevalonate kinase-like predicted kinase